MESYVCKCIVSTVNIGHLAATLRVIFFYFIFVWWWKQPCGVASKNWNRKMGQQRVERDSGLWLLLLFRVKRKRRRPTDRPTERQSDIKVCVFGVKKSSIMTMMWSAQSTRPTNLFYFSFFSSLSQPQHTSPSSRTKRMSPNSCTHSHVYVSDLFRIRTTGTSWIWICICSSPNNRQMAINDQIEQI